MNEPVPFVERKERRRVAAQAFAEQLRRRTPEQVAADRELIEWSNDAALRDAQW